MIKKKGRKLVYFAIVVFNSMMLTAQCGCPQIYDCFLFFNELDILDVRLHELYDHVDRFVLVESVETFRGNLKPLYYEQNRDRYQKFQDKIIHVVVAERIETTNPWDREEFQRNQIMRGLKDCGANDIVLISDVDEIVRASVIPQIVQALHEEKREAVVCEQSLYRYYFNVEDHSILSASTCAADFNYLKNTCPDKLRNNRHTAIKGGVKLVYPLIVNAGWHFTSIGGLEFHVKKLESFSHQERDFPENKTQQFIDSYIGSMCKIVPLDDTFPAYLLENQGYFREKGYFLDPVKSSRQHNIFKVKRKMFKESGDMSLKKVEK
jgi:hypothetical protein